MDTFMGIFVLALVAVSGIIVTGGAGWFVWRCAVDALRSDLDLHMRVVLGIMGLLTILALAFSYLAILI